MNDLHVISWNVTRRCNLECAHCYLPAVTGKDGRDHASSGELTTNEALQLIDQIAEANPEVMLILSGGEPLLREDIFELSAYAAGKGMMTVLGSNGLLIDDAVARKLSQSGVTGISISLDSIDPEIHDSTRSCKGAWERTVAAIQRCRDAGLSVQVNAVVTKKNCGELPALMAYSRRLGAKVFSPFFLVCTGRGEELTDISPQQYEKVLSLIVEAQGTYGDMMIRTRCAPTIRRVLYEKKPASPLLKMGTGRCLAGSSYCRITPEGDVTPCPYMTLPAGNVRKQAFADIWEKSGLFRSLRNPALRGKCKTCEYRLLCGGCRARAYAAHENYLDEDPWCDYIPRGGEMIKPATFDIESNTTTTGSAKPVWTGEAEERLKRVPFFVRNMVRGAVERYAIQQRYGEITPALMEEVKQNAMGGKFGGHR
jgi:radical SAM protein with 4Fe4S-binding SPASM domain